jgi:hypothetical protein
MTDGILNLVPTVVAGGVALKFIDVAYPKGKSKKKWRKNMSVEYGKPKFTMPKPVSVSTAMGSKKRTFKKTGTFKMAKRDITGVTAIASKGKKQKSMSALSAAGV